MLDIFVTATFAKSYQNLPEVIRKKADSKTTIFKHNPFHPSLRTKKLEPHNEEVWSFWIDRDHRIKFRFADATRAHFLFIGNRKDIYR